MAMANVSEDEEMADNKFEDFTISEAEIFFFKEEDGSIEDLTTHLKWILKITDPSKYTIYPFNDPNYFLNKENFTNSSNDEQGAVAMKVTLDSDSEAEMEPYWQKVEMNKLHGLGDPVEVLFSNTDSMP